MSSVDQSILSKVQKLLNMTQANGASIHEAETAAAAAQRLMTQHRISVADLGADTSEVIHNKNFLYAGERVVSWKSWLGVVLCEVNGCKMYIDHSRGGIQFQVIGRDSDIQIVTYFFNYLVNEIERLCKIEKAKHRGSGKTWTNSFKMGATNSIASRLKQADKEVRAAAVSASSTALVKVDMKDAEVAAWAEKNLKLRQSSAQANIKLNTSAYNSGAEAGNKIQLNKGMGGKSDPKLLT